MGVWLYSIAVLAQQPSNHTVLPQAPIELAGEQEPWPALQADDHLQPTPGYLVSYSYATSYYPKLREVLYTGLGDSPAARVVVQPSFTPEYVLSIDQKEQTYYLTYRICQASLWSTLAKTGKLVAVDTKAVELNPKLAKVIARLFNTAIAQTKYPGPVQRVGFDGTTFTFSAFQMGIGLQGGDTWSPPPGTHMGALVALTDHLKQLVAVPNDQALLTTLLREAEQLTTELKQK